MKSKKLNRYSSIWDIFKKVIKSPWMKSKHGNLYVDTKIWVEHKKNKKE